MGTKSSEPTSKEEKTTALKTTIDFFRDTSLRDLYDGSLRRFIA